MIARSFRLSIAVVSFNTRELTLRCLEATQRAADSIDSAFTLVDNGSRDGTVKAVQLQYPLWRTLVLPENPGYGSALNRAFHEAPGEFLLALNSDILMQEDALRLLVDFLCQHPQCGLVGPALTYPDGRAQPSARRLPGLGFALGDVLWLHEFFPGNVWLRRASYADEDLASQPWVDTVSGAAMLIRGEAFTRIGGFDEAFRMYFEETDLCRRLRGTGFRVALHAKAHAVHAHGASTIQTAVRQVEYYLSCLRFFRKHHGLGQARILAAAVALGTLARMVALLFKYPPVPRERRELLRSKLSACGRLLRQLRSPLAESIAPEVRP